MIDLPSQKGPGKDSYVSGIFHIRIAPHKNTPLFVPDLKRSKGKNVVFNEAHKNTPLFVADLKQGGILKWNTPDANILASAESSWPTGIGSARPRYRLFHTKDSLFDKVLLVL